ncbi:hypothetical protein CAOG_01708, partial [Capsaspora owczarzaki ATCC 30864]|uniref:Uncharacterized protein n=1 Tax=Capsaspora owczarzaki (strain ATCC 30864) TaxID=595528 RepID=A0A0D2WKY1_CAPO3
MAAALSSADGSSSPASAFAAEPFMRLQTALKKEKLFVTAEKQAIRDLFVDINDSTSKLLQLSWTTQRLQRYLELLVNNRMSLDAFSRTKDILERAKLVMAHSKVGPHSSNYEQMVRFLVEHPRLLAGMLMLSASSGTIATVSGTAPAPSSSAVATPLSPSTVNGLLINQSSQGALSSTGTSMLFTPAGGASSPTTAPSPTAASASSSTWNLDTESMLHGILFGLYGNFFLPEQELSVLTIMQSVLEDHLAKSENKLTCMRHNSTLTKMFTLYARSYAGGKLYLMAALAEPILAVLADDALDLEIEPVKVFLSLTDANRQLVLEQLLERQVAEGKVSPLLQVEGRLKLDHVPTSDELVSLPLMKATLNVVYDKLIELCVLFVDSCTRTLASMPYGIKWFCKQAARVARAAPTKSAQPLTQLDVYSLLGDLVFLRFINPAIVTPEPFGIVNTPISTTARRNLTLIAKVLHGVARGTHTQQQRESYMVPLRDRLQQVQIGTFFDALVNVGDIADCLQYVPNSVTHKGRKKTALLTLKELYAIQSYAVALQQQQLLAQDGAATTGAAAAAKSNPFAKWNLNAAEATELQRLLKRLPTPPPPPPSSSSAAAGSSKVPSPSGGQESLPSPSALAVLVDGEEVESEVLVLSIDRNPEMALMTESEVMALHQQPAANVASPPQAELLLADERKKLRIVLCSIDFSYQWRQRTMLDIFEAELVEAQALSNRSLASHIQETLRCLRRLPAEHTTNNCQALISLLQTDYKTRSKYVSYLVENKQQLLVTQDQLKRQMDRMARDRSVCAEQFKTVKIRKFLEKREPDIAQFVLRFQMTEMIDEKAALVNLYLRETLQAITGDPLFEGMSEAELEEAQSATEKHFMCRIYFWGFWPNGLVDIERDKVFTSFIASMAPYVTVDHESLQIPRQHQSEAPWPSAQKELLRINAFKAPGDKLNCIVQCCKTIIDLIQMSGKPAGADDFFPVLVYVIIQVNPPSMLSTMQYIRYFYESRAKGEGSYWWSQFTIAIEFIKTMEDKRGKKPNK